MTISIWYRYKGKEAERIDTASNEREASYLVGEYTIAYGCRPGQVNNQKCVVWAGRKKDDPTMREHF
jgi:hypothetical protein